MFWGKSLSRRERVPTIARWAAGEGYKTKEILEKYMRYPSPGSLARVTLSRRERDLLTSETEAELRLQLTMQIALAGNIAEIRRRDQAQ